jgi:hypothetical protein
MRPPGSNSSAARPQLESNFLEPVANLRRDY